METLARASRPLSLVVSLGCSLAIFAACGAPPAAVAPAPASSASASPSASAAPSSSSGAEAASGKAAACFSAARGAQPLARVELVGDELLVCVGSKGEPTAECLSIDPRSAKVSGAPAWARAAVGALPSAASPEGKRTPYEVKATANDLAICKLGSAECTTLKPGYAALPGVGWGEDFNAAQAAKAGSTTTYTRKLVAAANDDGTKVFVLAAEATKKGAATTWSVFGDTFEVANSRRIAHVLLSSSAGSSSAIADLGARWHVAWVGDRLWLAGTDPRSGASTQEFLDPNAGTTLELGHPSFLLSVGDAWLVGTQKSGYGLVKIVEPRSLANLGKYPLPNQPTSIGDGLPAYAVARGDGTAWVAFANPPGVMVVDVAKHAASSPVMLPICP